MEYENQCNHWAQEARAASAANSSQTMKTFEERIEGLATELMQEKLKSKLQEDDIKDMYMELEDRDGQLIHLHQGEATAQASDTMTPPGFPLPNGFHSGDGAVAGAGQDAHAVWLAHRMGQLKRNIADIDTVAPKFGAQRLDLE